MIWAPHVGRKLNIVDWVRDSYYRLHLVPFSAKKKKKKNQKKKKLQYCLPWWNIYNKATIQWKFFGYSKWRPLYRFNVSNPYNFQVFVDFMLKFYQLALLTWIKPRVVKKWKIKRPECPKQAQTARGCIRNMVFCRGSLVHSHFLFTYLRSWNRMYSHLILLLCWSKLGIHCVLSISCFSVLEWVMLTIS
jgi:hypothetical protein